VQGEVSGSFERKRKEILVMDVCSYSRTAILPVMVTKSLGAVLLLLLFCGAAAGQKKPKLQGSYRDWVDRDVVYIITKGERDTYLKLSSDEARDKFIEQFWEIRNPTPGSPSNTFKDEHYQRLAYANDHFGHESGNQGWKTAMGRVYIVLGPPSQKANYHDSQDLRPMEVWFYSNSHAALPPFFNIVFYREDNFSEYKLYSPYFDGPEKLVTQRGETRLQAWQKIDSAGGRALARVALSLIPGEPVDTTNATSGMESDMMLAILRDLPNHPLSMHELDIHRMNANVSASLIFQGETLGVLAFPVRNAFGDTRVDYLLRLSKPEDFSLAEEGDRSFFHLGVRVEVYSAADNKLLFTQERDYKKYLTAEQVEQVRSRIFGFEGSLPLPPGKYHLEIQLTDWLKKASYRVKSDAVIPKVPGTAIAVTDVVPFSTAKPIGSGDPNFVPFSFGGVQFTPLLKRETAFAGGGQLKFFYQIWTPPSAPNLSTDQEMKVSYAYGRPGVTQDSTTVEDKVSKAQLDAHGSLINGKEIAIGDWPPGNYRLVVTLDDPNNGQKAFSTLNFRLGAFDLLRPWGIDDRDDASKDFKSGRADYQRGLCYLAAGENAQASGAFREALSKNPGSEEFLADLIDADFARQAYADIAKLADKIAITDQTQERTLLYLAESLDKTGNPKQAEALLESSLKSRAPTGPVCLTLAKLYASTGDSAKADQYSAKGKQLMQNVATP
jgi:GWxTD domain-containing protein